MRYVEEVEWQTFGDCRGIQEQRMTGSFVVCPCMAFDTVNRYVQQILDICFEPPKHEHGKTKMNTNGLDFELI